jgi:hypothetical protein
MGSHSNNRANKLYRILVLVEYFCFLLLKDLNDLG